MADDATAIAGIYNHYITKTTVTFEEEPVTAMEIARRVEKIQSASLPWLIAETGAHRRLVGYAFAAPWKDRFAYRFSVEISIYLVPEHQGRGIGSQLYSHVIQVLQDRGIHTIIGGIALPNKASVALHEKFGLRKVAQFKEVGFKFNRWIAVGYWQRTL